MAELLGLFARKTFSSSKFWLSATCRTTLSFDLGIENGPATQSPIRHKFLNIALNEDKFDRDESAFSCV